MKGKTCIVVTRGSVSQEYDFPGTYPSFDLKAGTVDLNDLNDNVVDTLDLKQLRSVIFVPAQEATNGD